MADRNLPHKSLEGAILDSLSQSGATDLAKDILEIGIDAALDEGLLKDIPIVGTLDAIRRSGMAIRERLFIRKILSFLYELSNIPEEARIQFSQELENDAGTRDKAGAALCLILERLDDLEKPKIVGRIYKAKLEKRITFEELRRFCTIVERSFLPDLNALTLTKGDSTLSNTNAEYLEALGLVEVSVWDLGSTDGSSGKTYRITTIGRKFLDTAFPEPRL